VPPQHLHVEVQIHRRAAQPGSRIKIVGHACWPLSITVSIVVSSVCPISPLLRRTQANVRRFKYLSAYLVRDLLPRTWRKPKSEEGSRGGTAYFTLA